MNLFKIFIFYLIFLKFNHFSLNIKSIFFNITLFIKLYWVNLIKIEKKLEKKFNGQKNFFYFLYNLIIIRILFIEKKNKIFF
jgi:hypothetical protein